MAITRLRLIILLTPIAFASKKYTGYGAEYVVGYLADIIAVVVLYLALRAITKIEKYKLAFLIFGFALFIEFSQLIQHPILDKIRSIRLGQIIVGGSFDWFDILAYFVGLTLALCLEQELTKPQSQR
jgi:Protein of unknown function (DUF2809)